MQKLLAVLAAALIFLTSDGFEAVFVGTAAQAQDSAIAPDFGGWNLVALRAENATQAGRASDAAMTGLRDELVEWRSIFLAGQDVNKARIETLSSQIAALGPVPETGVEPEELSLRRAELVDLISSLEAPVRRAEEAYTRADGLIRETDQIIRNRQAETLFRFSPSPANPAIWPEAVRAVSSTVQGLKSEVQAAFASDTLQVRLRENLVRTLVFLLVAFVLLLRGRIWMVRATGQVQRSASGAKARLLAFLVSLGQVALPAVGIFAVVEAIFSAEILGFRGQLIVEGFIPVGLAFFAARWLVLRLLPRGGEKAGLLDIDESGAEPTRLYFGILAVIWGLQKLLADIAEFEGYSQATQNVLNFPLFVAAGFLLIKLGRILSSAAQVEGTASQQAATMRIRSVELFGRLLALVGMAGPVAAVVGFTGVALAFVYPTILTIGLIALVSILAGVMRDVFGMVTGRDEDAARDALIPVLMSFTLVVAALPFLALIWGARVADLSEIWSRFREGFELGDTRISATDFLTFAAVFVIGYMATRVIQSALKTSVLPKTSIDPGGQTAIISGVGYLGIFLAAVIAISTAGIDLSSLAIVAGALSVGIGFGLQNIVSNFVSGIILLIERPIAEGDWIDVGGYSGTVREISVRSTRVETFDRTDVIIPNSDLVSGTVTNYTRGNLIGRAVISVGVAYGSDTDHVQEILLEIAKAHPMVSLQSGPWVHLVGFGADSLDFEVRAVLRDVNFILAVKSEIHHSIVRRFAEESIEIPFAQRDLWLRNPEVLSPPTSRKPVAKPK